jgi:hypothetical protein
MSPWRYKKTTQIVSPAAAGCFFKAEAMLGALRVALSPLPLAKGERTKVRGLEPHNCRLPLVNPHPPLSLRKGEATRCTYRIPSA